MENESSSDTSSSESNNKTKNSWLPQRLRMKLKEDKLLFVERLHDDVLPVNIERNICLILL